MAESHVGLKRAGPSRFDEFKSRRVHAHFEIFLMTTRSFRVKSEGPADISQCGGTINSEGYLQNPFRFFPRGNNRGKTQRSISINPVKQVAGCILLGLLDKLCFDFFYRFGRRRLLLKLPIIQIVPRNPVINLNGDLLYRGKILY